MSKGRAFPHERRLQAIAGVALAAAVVLAAVAVLQGNVRLFGVALPSALPYALLAAGAIAGLVAIVRRATLVAVAAVLCLVLATLPANLLAPGALAWVVAYAFALAALVFAELVHMMGRYESAHRAVESDGLPEEHLNRVTDEALATLAGRAGIALLVAAAGLGLAVLLSFVGPAQWREALETRSPLGVALASGVLLGVGGLLVLFRGARAPWRNASSSPSPAQEIAPDVEP